MTYHHIEQLSDRKGEKVALLLTAENLGGLIFAALPAYIITANWPVLLRIVVVAVSAVGGIAATLDLGGMTFYERVLWAARGLIQTQVQGARIGPNQLPGTITRSQIDGALPVGGVVHRVVQHSPIILPVQPSPSAKPGDVAEILSIPVVAQNEEDLHADS